MTMQRWDPWGNMRSLRSAMDDLLERSFITSRLADEEGGGTSFPVDVSESETEVRVRASLPGIKQEDLDISVQGDRLTIRGETHEEYSSGGENWQRREIRTGSFARSFALPSDVDSDACEANFEDGILELRLPKKEEAKPRKIQIGGSSESIPSTMRAGSSEAQTTGYEAAPTTETSSAQAAESPPSQPVASGATTAGGVAPSSQPYERQEGVDETPGEDPFGLREEERKGDLT